MHNKDSRRFPIVFLSLFLVFFFHTAVSAEKPQKVPNNLQDPYAVLNNHYQAIGGLERLKKIRTSYSEGKTRHDGLLGRFKHWEARPLQHRTEQDYKAISMIEGDSGQFSWLFDTNGQLLIHKTPEVFQRREIARLFDKYEHLKPESPFFSVSYQKMTEVNTTSCHEILITNSINSDKMYFYFDTESYYLIQSVVEQPDVEITTIFDDFREQNGFILSFHQRTKYLPWEKEEETWVERYLHNPKIEESFFDIPAPVKDYKLTGTDKGKSSTTIPFQFIENLIYLPVTIQGDTKYWVLDSGATMSVIDVDYAHSLGLEEQGSIQGYGFGDLFKLSFVTLPQCSVGNLVFDSQKLYGSKGLAKDSYEPVIHGILGYDFLSRFVVEIDYDTRNVTLHLPESFSYNGKGVVIDAPLKYRTFTLPVNIDQKFKSKWSLDLGAFHSSIHYKFAEKHNLLDTPGVESVSQGLSTVSLATTAQFNCLAIDRLQIDYPLISIPLEKGKGATALGEVGGNLGNSTLQHFHLWLNYPEQQIILEKGGHFNKTPPRDKSGLVIGLTENDQPLVSFVAGNSPAENAGIIAGDIIFEMNGINLPPGHPTQGLRDLLRGAAGTKISLKMLRGKQQLETGFVLQDLYPQNGTGCAIASE